MPVRPGSGPRSCCFVRGRATQGGLTLRSEGKENDEIRDKDGDTNNTEVAMRIAGKLVLEIAATMFPILLRCEVRSSDSLLSSSFDGRRL